MTSALAELLISAVELVEVEGLRLRRRAKGLMQSLVMMLVAGGLLIAAAVWLTWATFTALATALSPALAGFIIGGVSLLLAGVFLWLSRRP
jgi:predicted phage tail protein